MGEWKETRTRSFPQVSSTAAGSTRAAGVSGQRSGGQRASGSGQRAAGRWGGVLQTVARRLDCGDGAQRAGLERVLGVGVGRAERQQQREPGGARHHLEHV